MQRPALSILLVTAALAPALGACGDNEKPPEPEFEGHGPVAEGIMAPLGEPLPSASAEQLATFERGMEVMVKRFSVEEGLGPAFNVTFCGACHEKPTFGGSAGKYRDFFIAGNQEENGPFFFANGVDFFDCGTIEQPPEERVRNPPPESDYGAISGVVRMYYYGETNTPRPDPNYAAELNVVAKRNPIPFFGVGLIAELEPDEILSREDPDDEDGDGISGRANKVGSGDDVFIGRFGLKAQTDSIEGFIRGPLFNHLGITSDPLSNADRALLPVDSSDPNAETAMRMLDRIHRYAQAAAPGLPNCDVDDVPDPELSRDELFDLISASMLLAAPQFEEESEQAARGREAFDEANCGGCHAPRLRSPRGLIPVYSDILLHDMGPGLADGLTMAQAAGSEFRTQPLWGLAATGPYLHDGRAHTIEEAILWHGGEASRSRDAYAAFSPEKKADLQEFLLSLGGRSQYSPGLLAPGTELPAPGEAGGPLAPLSPEEAQRFEEGLALFDHEFGQIDGLGGPRFNGDSCRACHFEPTIGGAGPRGVNVMRHGLVNQSGEFVMPQIGTTILHKTTTVFNSGNFAQQPVGAEQLVYEHRQTPSLFGAGLIDAIPDENIIANADPNDDDGDGISGRVSRTDGNRLGRFGWKAQVPSLEEFVRDAVTAELGMTLDAREGLTFGKILDNDETADPEIDQNTADALLFFMQNLAAPKAKSRDAAAEQRGAVLFEEVGCDGCHIPALEGAGGPVRLYSDLLLHEILPVGALGIEDSSANMREFRTPPLWGVRETGPYLHTGEADTLDQAIRKHDGEALGVRQSYEALSAAERSDLILFVESI